MGMAWLTPGAVPQAARQQIDEAFGIWTLINTKGKMGVGVCRLTSAGRCHMILLDAAKRKRSIPLCFVRKKYLCFRERSYG